MKLVRMQIPDTRAKVSEDGEQNRFLVNLRGIIDVKTKDLKLSEFLEWKEIWLSVRSASKELILPKDSFERLKKVVDETKGWGSMEQGIEIAETFKNAEVSNESGEFN